MGELVRMEEYLSGRNSGGQRPLPVIRQEAAANAALPMDLKATRIQGSNAAQPWHVFGSGLVTFTSFSPA
jgi:hypothetical protein